MQGTRVRISCLWLAAGGLVTWLRRRPLIATASIVLAIGVFEVANASFMADDFIQLGILEGVSPLSAASPFGLYTFADGDPARVRAVKSTGAFPWFTEPGFKLRFFRPLSSGLLAADHAVAGLQPHWYRAHTVVWLLLLVVGVGVILRRAVPGPVGALALLIFSVSGIHGILCWTATRHILVAAAIGVLALASHLRWHEEKWELGRVFSIGGLSIALAASEAAVAVIAFLLAYEALAAPGAVKDRLRAAFPSLLLAGSYAAAYFVFGLGASGTSGYLDPLSGPLAFVRELPGRLAVLLGALALGGNADLWVLRPDLRTTMIAVGATVVALFLVLLKASWSAASPEGRRGAGWLGAGAVAAAVPFAGTPIGSRCLVIPLVGACALFALVIRTWWTVWRRRPGPSYRLFGGLSAALVLIQLVLGPAERFASPVALRILMNERLASAMREAEINPAGLSQRSVVVLRAPGIVLGFHSYFYRRLYRLPMPASWRVLSWAAADHRFTRSTDDTLTMSVERGEIDAPNLRVGDVMSVGDMEATVLQTDGRGPTRVRFRFSRSLDDPSMLLLAWQNGRLRGVRPPAIGQSLALPRN